MMEIRTEIRGHEELQRAMSIAPNRLGARVRTWVSSEARGFIADWRKSLKQKPRKFRSGTWSNRIGGQFKWYATRGKTDINTTATMGANMAGRSGFPESVAKMEEGYTQRTQNAFVVPLSQGFERVHLSMDQYRTGRKDGTFKRLLREPPGSAWRLFPINLPGGLFFALTGFGGSQRLPLLFMARRSMRVPKQFSFLAEWQRRVPSVEERGEKAIGKEIDAIYS
jgi:hypothetical protein